MRRGIVYGCSAVGATLGLVYGYGFGREISGPGLGMLLALNAGIFAGLVVGMALDWLIGQSASRTRSREP